MLTAEFVEIDKQFVSGQSAFNMGEVPAIIEHVKVATKGYSGVLVYRVDGIVSAPDKHTINVGSLDSDDGLWYHSFCSNEPVRDTQ